MTIIYSFLLILATCVFWFIRLDNILNIFQSMYEAGKWPIGIYPPWLRTMLTFLVPIGFAITVPTEGLVGRLTSPNLLGAIALATVGTLLTAIFAGLAASWLFDMSTLEGLLVGSILSATDGAAIFGILRGSTLRRRLREWRDTAVLARVHAVLLRMARSGRRRRRSGGELEHAARHRSRH